MADIISFRKARKSARRQQARQQADENRIRFGRTKAEKENDRRARERHEAQINGQKLDVTDME